MHFSHAHYVEDVLGRLKSMMPSWMRRNPIPVATCAALFLSLACAAGIFVLGSDEIATNEWARTDRVFVLDDGEVTATEYQETIDRQVRENQTGPITERCKRAQDRYLEVAEFGLPALAPPLVKVPDGIDPADTSQSCIIREERRSAAAGLSVMVSAALAGISMLLFLVLTMLSLTRIRPTLSTRIPAWIIAILVVAIAWFLAGRYRNERHLVVTVVIVALAVGQAISILLAVADTRSEHAFRSGTQSLKDVRNRRYLTRTTTLALSAILSLATALVAVLNGRFIETEKALGLKYGPFRLGGFGPEDVATITALEGLAFVIVLGSVSLPAIIKTEQLGTAVLDKLVAPADDAPLDALVANLAQREDLGEKLGLASRPVGWIENGIVLLLPLITGASADLLGLLN